MAGLLTALGSVSLYLMTAGDVVIPTHIAPAVSGRPPRTCHVLKVTPARSSVTPW